MKIFLQKIGKSNPVAVGLFVKPTAVQELCFGCVCLLEGKLHLSLEGNSTKLFEPGRTAVWQAQSTLCVCVAVG